MSKVNITELIDASSVLEIHMKLVSQRSQYFTHIHEGILDLILDTSNSNFLSVLTCSDHFVLCPTAVYICA